MADLPAEVWLRILELAAGDDQPLDYALPTSMTESSWFKMLSGNWGLRTPHESCYLRERERLAMLKAVASTCKSLRQYVSEFLYKSLFFTNAAHIQTLAFLFDQDRNLGKWARRIHIVRYPVEDKVHMQDVLEPLLSIVRRSRKLQFFIAECPVLGSFAPIADALCCSCSRTLRTLHLNLSSDEMAKVIWTLDLLPALVSLHLDFAAPSGDIVLGSASGLALTLPNLQQLSLRGFVAEFIEEATAWVFPSLRIVSFDFMHFHEDLPDILEFLTHQGRNLTFLDIYSIPPLDVASVLDLCPMLQTFAFNMDWRLPVDASVTNTTVAKLVHSPHMNITTIGCYELLYAFGVGYAAAHANASPLAAQHVRHSNDMNFAALNKQNFPNLSRIRVLDRTLLRDLEVANGPHGSCFSRWERWWAQCARQRIRLEDCTGAELGNLPEDGEDDEFDDGEGEEEEGDVDDEEEIVEVIEEVFVQDPRDPLTVIRDLVEECRAVSEELSGSVMDQFYDTRAFSHY
ncbi:hypothetical protein K474DRAFT_1590845 [Panus rudis PR-1116 ss-1]|nr:hypothetical protein K474DRAFT_1590845 [Panus rudis PR-1116 ss-1]